ncbi:sialate O-acetylesterase [Pedobacter cryotolerans]|uniref:Sialate O-acetylesterase n=1 Tax=Pedobacter cryotolerans TaxID=2571270 RepID=A0A4U1BV52_9SPHI|nr:sialate O-acetylesterase [Pedobacter cryotolerans]TKB96607.1 sialate O-acetylesterase [Pedobacter cryotolerans]
MHLGYKTTLLSLILFFSTFLVYADIRLPQLISDHMVLQRNTKLKIWGWGSIGEKISISFNGKSYNTTAGKDSKWLIMLAEMKAGGPYKMVLKGENLIVINDVLIGDVWFCSGQSNMVLTMERLKEKYPSEVSNDNFSEIRNFFIPTNSDFTKVHENHLSAKWKQAVGENILGMGGVTYFFAKKLYQKYKIPIGIINASVGGVPIEAWMSEEAFKDYPAIMQEIKNLKDTVYISNFNKLLMQQDLNNPARIIQVDKGLTDTVKWIDPNFKPIGWRQFWMPGYWADQGVKGLNGTIYFRKEIDIPASMINTPAKLFLGCIVDADSTFINGEFVGNTTYQYPPRRYIIKPGILKPGKNIIVIKVVNNSGKGGFVPDKNYVLNANGESIDLRGDWMYQIAIVQQNFISAGVQNEINHLRPIIAQNAPTGLFNTMTAPATNYAINGFLWYQGETNSGRPKEYAKLLNDLIEDWRMKWGQGNLPFVIVQLPNFMEVNYLPSESNWAQLRQSQLDALTIPSTGLAVGIDVGEWNDIHPLNKKDIGERLALWAEHLAFGTKNLVYSGPIYHSLAIEQNKIRLKFTNTGSGLISKNSDELHHFAIAGADKNFIWAKAKIDNNEVIVWSDSIAKPIYVRYAWADNPEGANLYNREGLPASPFEAFLK